MSDQVLSSEEVDAILKVTQEKQQQDLSKIVGSGDSGGEKGKHYSYALNNINELVRSECEKNLSSFLRKKAIIKTKSFNLGKVSACLAADSDKKTVYSVFRLSPNEHYGMVLVDLGLLHQIINLLFGGKINANEKTIENPGKVGTIVAEKLSNLCLTALRDSCVEYGALTYDILKTTNSQNLASNLGLEPDDQVYIMDLSIFFDEVETSLKLLLTEDFLIQFIPAKTEGSKHREKDFWRTAIKTQVVDSYVTINVTLPDVSMKVKDFMALKDGDLIPISDPTMVYVCLNNLKLFRASAGQA